LQKSIGNMWLTALTRLGRASRRQLAVFERMFEASSPVAKPEGWWRFIRSSSSVSKGVSRWDLSAEDVLSLV
jgi:hypothetical protein